MKKATLWIGAFLCAGSAWANPVASFQGSDTLAGVMTDAIIAAGMNEEIVYTGGGSGKGETALVNGEQGIAPMSREAKPEAIELARTRGVSLIPHVIALDGVGVFVHASNSLAGLDLNTLRDVFTCAITRWEQIPNSGKSGAIRAFRRNDASGTTDTFKHLVGVKAFGACVTVMAETVDIAEKTASDADAIGYSGATAKREKNRALPLAQQAGARYVSLSVQTVRDFSYPLARKLFVYEAAGSRKPSATEEKLLGYLLDRSFLDPIVQDHEFYTID